MPPKKHRHQQKEAKLRARNPIAFSHVVLKKCPDLKTKYAEKLNALRQGRYREADFEKLKGHTLFTIAVNKQDRLLMVPKKIKGVNCFLVIDEILNHDHHKSPFLKPCVLKAYMDNKADEFVEDAPLVFESYDGSSLEHNDSETEELDIDPESISFYNEFSVLTDEQLQALNSKFPVVVLGGPGSGKSCVGLEALLRTVLSAKTQEFLTLWYVSKSKTLTRTMASKFQTHPFLAKLKESGNARVEFLPYNKLRGFSSEPSPFEQLKEEKIAQSEEKKLFSPRAQKEHFDFWLKAYQRKQLLVEKARKTPMLDTSMLENPELVYQEFGLLAAYNRTKIQKKYIVGGQNLSNFKEKEQRQIIYDVFMHYAKDHPDDLSLFPPEEDSTEGCDILVLDEGQEFTPIEIKWMLNKVKNHQVMVFYSHDQFENGLLANRQFLAELLPKAEFIQLPHNFRNPADVTDFVNEVTALKVKIAGNSDKRDFHPLRKAVHDKPGFIYWVDLKNEFDYSKYANQIVITLEKYLQVAQDRFPNATVVTAKDVRGLEFEEVVLYNMLDEDSYEIAAKVLASTKVETLSDHRAKVAGNECVNPAFNRFITGLTRATHRVTIIQKPHHRLKPLIGYFKSKLPKYSCEEGQIALKPKSEMQLIADAKELYSGGFLQQSQSILEGLGKDALSFFTIWQVEKNKCAQERFDFPAQETKQEPHEKPFSPELAFDKDSCSDTDSIELEKHAPIINILNRLPKEKKQALIEEKQSNLKDKAVSKKIIPEQTLREFVRRFSENPTQANLKIICSYHKASALLFGKFKVNNTITSLFRSIISKKEWLNTFYAFLDNEPQYLKLFTAENLCEFNVSCGGQGPDLFWIISTELGWKIFNRLGHDCFSKITEEAFYTKFTLSLEQGNPKDFSVFSYLCQYEIEKNHVLLLKLFQANPSLRKLPLAIKDLDTVRLHLAKSPDGCLCLKIIKQNRPDLIHYTEIEWKIITLWNNFTIPVLRLWFESKDTIELIKANFVTILNDKERSATFLNFLQNCASARSHFDLRNLCTMFTVIESENLETMPLLFSLLEGVFEGDKEDMLQRLALFDTISEQYSDMAAESFYKKNRYGRSVFLILATYRSEYLIKLFLANPSLLQEMTQDALYTRALSNKPFNVFDKYEQHSPLRGMALKGKGCELILIILKAHPSWKQNFPLEVLYIEAHTDQEKVSQQDSTLQLLAASPQGRQVIFELLTGTPSLMRKITRKIWSDVPSCTVLRQSAISGIRQAAPDENINKLLPALLELAEEKPSSHKDNKPIKTLSEEAIQKNAENFAKNPSTSNLKKILGHAQASTLLFGQFKTSKRYINLLRFILSNEQLSQGLDQVLNEEPHHIKLFTAEKLCELSQVFFKVTPDDPHHIKPSTDERLSELEASQIPILFWLTNTEIGLGILQRLDNACLSQITKEAVFANYSPDKDTLCVFRQIAYINSEQRHAFLLKTLKVNPKLFEGVKKEMTSILRKKLKQTNAGLSILQMIAERELSLIDETIPNDPISVINTSQFRMFDPLMEKNKVVNKDLAYRLNNPV